MFFLTFNWYQSTICALSITRATEKDPVRKTCLLSVKHPFMMLTTPPPTRKIATLSSLHPSMKMLYSFLGGRTKCTVTSS